MAVAALSHPNILAIHDFGTQDGTAYAVTELLEGETLRGKLDTGPIAQRQAIDYALQVAQGPRRRPREGHRPSGPEAREPVRLEGRPSQDPRLRAGEESRGRRSGGEDERGDGLGPHRARDGDGDDGLHVARAGAGPARRSPLGPLLVRNDPLRDALGQEGVQAGHGERHDRGDPEGGSAGADAVGAERLAGPRPHRQALPGEGPETGGSSPRRTSPSRFRRRRLRRRRAACSSRRHRPARRWFSSPLRRRSSFSPRWVSSSCAGRHRAAGRGRRRQARRCPAVREPRRSRGRLLRRRDRGRGARQAHVRCRASRSSRGAARRPTRRRPRRRRRSRGSSTPTTC